MVITIVVVVVIEITVEIVIAIVIEIGVLAYPAVSHDCCRYSCDLTHMRQIDVSWIQLYHQSKWETRQMDPSKQPL